MRTHSFSIFSLLLLTAIPASGQYILTGTVTDTTGETLPGATIFISDSVNTATDAKGNYSINLPRPGSYNVRFSFIGYEQVIKPVSVTAAGSYRLDAILHQSAKIIGTVITAGRYGQPIEEVTVSMDVVDFKAITALNPATAEEVLDQVPGVNVSKTQVSMRGGSSWSFGAGSRTLMLVDGLPLLSADARDIKWTSLPLEAIDQVEVIKGASSALYGSAALDGIINIRTLDPGNEPATRINLNYGFYDSPPVASYKYWQSPPALWRIQAMHGRRIGAWSLLASADLLKTDGYREGENRQVTKGFLKVRHKPDVLKGLSCGFNLTVLSDTGGNFLYWEDRDKPLLPDSGTLSRQQNKRIIVDPVIEYVRGNTRHALLGRVFVTDNKNNTSQDSKASSWYGEYQFQKFFPITEGYSLHWNHGFVANYTTTRSDSLYGVHDENNFAIYGQLNQKVGKVNFSFGSRVESYQVDTFKRELFPIFRSGIALQVAKGTYLRASLGQGIRYPSVAERFTETTGGGVVVYPNPGLIPERGWSAETGLRQLLGGKKIKGWVDAALFWSEYSDMIEFTFGNYKPPAGFGFAAVNVTDARVYGLELSGAGQHEWKDIASRFAGGYDFITPLDLNHIPSATDTLGTEQFLKYRYRHSAKGSYTISWKFISASVFMRYNSYMMNIDEVLTFIVSGLKEYREENEHGDLVFDGTLSFTWKGAELAFHARNMLNREYTYFPGNMGAPRSFVVRMSWRG